MVIVSLPDAAVKVSRDRVGTALVNAGTDPHRFCRPPIRGSSANPRHRQTGKYRPNTNPVPRVRQVSIAPLVRASMDNDYLNALF